MMSRRSFALGYVAALLTLVLVAVIGFLVVSTGSQPTAPSSGTQTPGTQTPGTQTPGTQRPVTPAPGSPEQPPDNVAPGETWLGDVELRSSQVQTADGPLRDVHAQGSAVTLTADGLRAGRLTIDATLPFETAADQIGEGIELFPVGELAGMRRSVELLGRQVDIEATGRVRAEGGRLVIEPETVDLGSFEWIDRIASAAVRSLVTIRHTVTGIPAGMGLDTVDVRPDGFRVELSGSDVRIG
jgi:hypothetical protein